MKKCVFLFFATLLLTGCGCAKAKPGVEKLNQPVTEAPEKGGPVPVQETSRSVSFTSDALDSRAGEKAFLAEYLATVKKADDWREKNPSRKVVSFNITERGGVFGREPSFPAPYTCRVTLLLEPPDKK